MAEELDKKTTITFDCGSPRLKARAVEAAKNFQPGLSISLSSLCRLALEQYLKKSEGIKK